MLAYSGYAEAKNKHGLFPCVTATPRSLAKDRGFLYRLFLVGGINPDDPHNPEDNREHAGMVFFRDRVGPVLNKAWVKVSQVLYSDLFIYLVRKRIMFHCKPNSISGFGSDVLLCLHRHRLLGSD